MATPPFDPNETAPAPNDLISQFPGVEQSFRDVIESWILWSHNRDGNIELPDLAGSTPTFAADEVGIWQEGGVPKFRVGSGTVTDFLSQATADTRYLQLSGGTLTGDLTIQKAVAAVILDNDAGLSGSISLTAGDLQLEAPVGEFMRFAETGGGDLVGFQVRQAGAFHEIYSRNDRASQAEAESGSNSVKVMTPLRTAQAIDAQVVDTYDTTAEFYDFDASGHTSSIDITGLGDAIEVMIILESLNGSGSGAITARTSNDNGATFDSGSADYETSSGTASELTIISSTSGPWRSVCKFYGFNKGNIKSVAHAEGSDSFIIGQRAVQEANDAIRILIGGTANVTTGKIHVIKRIG